MLKIKRSVLKYFAGILVVLLLASCGYDTALQYKTKSSVSYRLKITTDSPQKAAYNLKQAFMDEGLELALFANYGHTETYYIQHGSSQISVNFYYDMKRGVIAIWPARLNAYSSKGREELKKREAVILRIKSVLEQTDSFAEYIYRGWECEYGPSLPGC